MKAAVLIVTLFICVLFFTGCGSNSAIKAYAIVAEEHAEVMKLTFENCLSEQDLKTKDALCNAVRSSINAYKQSASELKSIKSDN